MDWPDDTFVAQLPALAFMGAVIFSVLPDSPQRGLRKVERVSNGGDPFSPIVPP